MRLIEKIVKDLNIYLEDKEILEIACGDSDFSLTTSNIAKKILATDISLERINNRKLKVIPSNIVFKEMNAAKLLLDDNSFDVCVCYNALAHLKNDLDKVLSEMCRVTLSNGYLLYISSWKMDISLLNHINNDLISNTNCLELINYVKTNEYNALIIKKVDLI